jgi:hypothetical protein
MAKMTNNVGSLRPIYKESYPKAEKKKRRRSFDKLRNKLLSDWKPKKEGSY